MNSKELLNAYRTAVIELEELETQLARVGTDGRPSAAGGSIMGNSRGTNNGAAAALQLAEGIEARIARKREELAALSGPIGLLMAEIADIRTYLVVQHYYLMAESDYLIAHQMQMSQSRVNQMRREYLRQAS